VGCLRTLVSYQAVCAQAAESLDRGIISSIDPSKIEGPDFCEGVEHIIDMALRNDKLSINLIHDVGNYLGTALAGVITIVNPGTIIIHSNFVRAGDIFTAPVKLSIQRNTLDASISRLEIAFTPLRPFTVAEGAALFALMRRLELLKRQREVPEVLS
jgi:predicted NBD/HSP70 family sugar kinase